MQLSRAAHFNRRRRRLSQCVQHCFALSGHFDVNLAAVNLIVRYLCVCRLEEKEAAAAADEQQACARCTRANNWAQIYMTRIKAAAAEAEAMSSSLD